MNIRKASFIVVALAAVSITGVKGEEAGNGTNQVNNSLTVLSSGANEAAANQDSPFGVTSDSKLVDDCTSIGEGSVPFFLVNTEEPDEVIFLALEKLPGNLELFLTDQAWNGTKLEENVPEEGTLFVSDCVVESSFLRRLLLSY